MRAHVMVFAATTLVLPLWWPQPVGAQAKAAQTTCTTEPVKSAATPSYVRVRGQFAAVPGGIVLFSPKCPNVRFSLTETVVGIVGLTCKKGGVTGIACALAGSKGALIGTVSGKLSCKAGTAKYDCSIEVWDINDVAQDSGL